MTDKNIDLSRRKILAGLGAVGAAGAGAGFGTSALFSDEESFEGNMITAGTLDLSIGYYSYWDQGMAGGGSLSGNANGESVSAKLGDVKPGDDGLLAFCPQINSNPVYLWLCGAVTANDENSVTEPEADADVENNEFAPEADIDGDGELAERIEVDVRYCDIEMGSEETFTPESTTPRGGAPVFSGTLAELLENGLPLDGDAETITEPGGQACFDGTGAAEVDNPCICIDWEVPIDVGNEIQSDSLEFDLTFFAEQCRNNDGVDNPCGTTQSVENVYVGYEDRTGEDFDYNDFGMDATIEETYTVDPETLSSIEMSFVSTVNDATDDHTVHVKRDFDDDVSYEYEITRDESATSNEDDAGSYSGSGPLDVELFDSADFTDGNEVTVTVTDIDGAGSRPSGSSRGDVAANHDLFAAYDPYMDNRSQGTEWHIGDMQDHADAFELGDDYEVPYILVVPDSTNFDPPSEGTTIDGPYSDFDEYYESLDSQYADWFDT